MLKTSNTAANKTFQSVHESKCWRQAVYPRVPGSFLCMVPHYCDGLTMSEIVALWRYSTSPAQ